MPKSSEDLPELHLKMSTEESLRQLKITILHEMAHALLEDADVPDEEELVESFAIGIADGEEAGPLFAMLRSARGEL